MADQTDAAVETLADDLANIYRGSPGLMKDRMLVVARHVLTRQPGPEDVERLAKIMAPLIACGRQLSEHSGDNAEDCARAILALYSPPPAPAHAPTRSALDSALDPMLGNTPVRKAVVDTVLGLFDDARRPLTEADVERVAELEAELAEAKYNIGDTTWWRHKKRDSVYMELCRAELQSSMPLDEGDTMVVYSGEDGKFWTRPEDEFDDGRFERVGDPMTEPTGSAQSQAATPPPGTIRLGEGLTAEQEAWKPEGKVFQAQGMERAADALNGFLWAPLEENGYAIKRLREWLKDTAAALRASATPKPAAFLAEDYAHVADLISSEMGADDQSTLSAILSNNLNVILAALRAGGV